MARAATDAAQNANTQYSAASTTALNNANASAAKGNDDISSLEANNPYTSKALQQQQNLLTSGAMHSTNMAGEQQLNDAALRTGTNTASLGRTIASNNREGQRTMDQYNAQTAVNNTDKSTQLQEGLIGARNAAAQTQGGLYGTSAGGQGTAEGNLTAINGQNQQLWGSAIAAAGAMAGAGIGKA